VPNFVRAIRPEPCFMYLIAIAWMYVALMMAVAEATHSQGSVLGALITLLLYGVAPLALVLYLVGTPARQRARRAAEAAELRSDAPDSDAVDPDRGGHAPGVAVPGPVAPVREEP
jgi:hypothetical protein